MPRWPGGLHLQTGGQRATGTTGPRRYPATPQTDYWRRTATELLVTAQAGPQVFPPGFLPQGTPIYIQASAGPSAAGERWEVHQVQVNLPGQPQSPLVTQQTAAQATGATTPTPPPNPAQVWLTYGGPDVAGGHLLAQTVQGANDGLGLGGQVVNPGEFITVRWWGVTGAGPFPGFGWAVIKGTRYALSVT